MTLNQALRAYRTRSVPPPREPVRGLRHVQADDGAADHFLGQETHAQYVRLFQRGKVYWLQVVRT